MITFISFRPIKEDKGLIGFCSFKYFNDSLNGIAVRKLKNPKGKVRIRLMYPENKFGEPYFKPSPDAQKDIDEEVNSFILANYKETIK